MEKKLFKSGDVVPVSGNYRFERHASDSKECIRRMGVYLHLMKGMKLPLHDECLQPCVYSLMTVTEEETNPKILGM